VREQVNEVVGDRRGQAAGGVPSASCGITIDGREIFVAVSDVMEGSKLLEVTCAQGIQSWIDVAKVSSGGLVDDRNNGCPLRRAGAGAAKDPELPCAERWCAPPSRNTNGISRGPPPVTAYGWRLIAPRQFAPGTFDVIAEISVF
jgi:hypothetical protein